MRQVIVIISCMLISACAGIRPRYHTVSGGESLVSIARHYAVPMVELERYNREKLAVGLKAGQKLFVPFESSAEWENAVYSSTPTDAGATYDTGVAPFLWPVRGRISSKFGFRNIGSRGSVMHEGIDIAVPAGTPVHSARAGHVVYAASKIPGYGRMIVVRHAGGISTIYAHLASFSVKKGQFLARGQVLGRVGKTGRATGYHLHFEVRSKSAPVNPLLYLERSRQDRSLLRVSSR